MTSDSVGSHGSLVMVILDSVSCYGSLFLLSTIAIPRLQWALARMEFPGQ